jgi:hypothetical protein
MMPYISQTPYGQLLWSIGQRELFQDYYNPSPDVEGTVAIRVDKLLTNAWHCVAIERTQETESRGKYLFIFRETDTEKAKEYLGNLIEAFGRDSDREFAKIALKNLLSFPNSIAYNKYQCQYNQKDGGSEKC